jgi:hypothetical protein
VETKRFASEARQRFLMEVGKYLSVSGVNKFYPLVSAINIGITHLGYENVISYIEEDIKKMKDYEEKTGNKTILGYIKNWNNLRTHLNWLMARLGRVQFAYDLIKKKKMKDETEVREILNYRKEIKRISPFQPEIYYLYEVIIRMSDMQMLVVPNQYIKSAELSEYTKDTFTKPPAPKHETPTETSGGNT